MHRHLVVQGHVPRYACCQYYGQDGHYLGGDDCRFSRLLDGLKKEESARESKVDEKEGELLWSLMLCLLWRKVDADAMVEDGGLDPMHSPAPPVQEHYLICQSSLYLCL